jgi:beta-glucosidase
MTASHKYCSWLSFRASAYYPSDAALERILNGLTLEEKVGQIAQLGIDDFVDPSTDTVNEDFAVKALNVDKVGSVLNTYGGNIHPRSTWATIVSILQNHTIHGATFVDDSTIFPQEIDIQS